MTPRTEALLEELAASLGVAVDVLWAALLRQAALHAVFDVLVVSGCVVAMSLLWRWHKKQDEGDPYDWMLPPAALTFIGMAILVLVCLLSTYGALTATLNPEYWALKQILSAAGGAS